MGTITFELPNGIRQASGEWTKEVELAEMEGEEEDIINDIRRKEGVSSSSNSERITKILSRCTVRVGNDIRQKGDRYTTPDWFRKTWLEGLSSDRAFCILQLRIAACGHMYDFPFKCPYCAHEMPSCSLDLRALKTTYVPLANIAKDTFTFTAPNGDLIAYRLLTGNDESSVESIIRDQKDGYLSHLLEYRTVSVNGKTEFGGLNYFKRASIRTRKALAKDMDEREGDVKLFGEVECEKDSCRRIGTKLIEVLSPAFFIPSETPSSPSTNASLSQSGGGSDTETS